MLCSVLGRNCHSNPKIIVHDVIITVFSITDINECKSQFRSNCHSSSRHAMKITIITVFSITDINLTHAMKPQNYCTQCHKDCIFDHRHQ